MSMLDWLACRTMKGWNLFELQVVGKKKDAHGVVVRTRIYQSAKAAINVRLI